MLFSHILGNEAAKQTLTGLLEQKKLPHALLFAGPDGVGKSVFALETAKALLVPQLNNFHISSASKPRGSTIAKGGSIAPLNTTPLCDHRTPGAFTRSKCENFSVEALGEKAHARCISGSHPDLHSLRPEGKAELHTIEAIRALIEEAAFPPFEAPCKVFIFHEADRMLPTSSNALLKTLEEPQPNTYFLLLTSHEGAILPTIASRTRKIPFFPIPDPAIQQHVQTAWGKDPVEAERIALLAGGSFAKAEALTQQQSTQWRERLHAALQTGECSKLLAALEEDVPDTDLLLEAIFAYHRDRHLAAAKKNDPRPRPSLEEALERLLTARTALERHTSLRATLEYLINN